MPVYEYQGQHYDLETTDPAAAKAKILNYLGVKPPEAGTLETVGANLAGGFGSTLAGAGAAAADYTGFGNTANYLDEKRKQIQEFQKEHGGETTTGRIAGGVGGMAPALVAAAAAAPLTGGSSIMALLADVGTNAALFAIPAFRDTYNEQIKAGASPVVAAEHAAAEAGLMMVGGHLIGSGGKAVNKALGVGESLIPKVATAAGEGAVFTGANIGTHAAIDTANDRQTPDKSAADILKEMGESAATFGILRGVHHFMPGQKPPAKLTREEELQQPATTKAGQAALDIVNAPPPETPPPPPAPIKEREVNVQPPINTTVGTSDAVAERAAAEPTPERVVAPNGAGVAGDMSAPVPPATRTEEQPAALKYDNPDIQNVYDAYANYKGKTWQGSPELAEFKISRLTDVANIYNQPINVWLHQGEIVTLGANVEKPKYARLIGTINPTGEAAPEAPATPVLVPPPQAPAEQKTSGIGDYHVGLPTELNDTFERLQNRNRAAQRSIVQMKDVANKTDYDRLSIDPNFGSGAPVVISDFKLPDTHLGNTDVATAADGRKIPVQYAVVSAENLLPSHTSDGQVNKQYADTDVPAIRPVAGNGRVAGLQEGYMKDSPSIRDYATKMAEDTRHGIDPEVINNTPNPVLVRIMPKDKIAKDIGDVSNVSTGLELSPLEKAKNDANRLDLNNVEFEEAADGSLKLNKRSANQFIQAMPENERGQLVDSKGEPNSAAMDRLRNAMFWKAYSSDRLGHLYTEATDPEAKLILNAMQTAVPKMARLEGAGEYDIRPNVVEAAEMAVNARRNDVPLKELINQTDMTRDPTTHAVLEMFADHSRSGKRMGELLGNFADEAHKQANAGEDMFGEVPKRPLHEITEALKPQEEEVKVTPPEENKALPHLDETGINPREDRHPQVQAAAKLLKEGKITREEFAKYSDTYKPVFELSKEKLNPPTTDEKMLSSVNSDKRDKVNVPVADGTLVGLRMDLPALKRGGAVVSIHEGRPGLKNPGNVISFQSVGHLIGGKKGRVTFETRSQEKGLDVAIGEKGRKGDKEPLQTVEGKWQNITPEAAYAKVKELMGKPGWTQVGVDPSRHGYFYDRKTGEPVKSAEEVYQIGNSILAKDVEYAPKSEFLYMLRDATPEQMKSADSHAKDVGGDVVYQKGDTALVRGFSVLSGQPIYSVAKGDTRSRTDIESYTGKLVSDKEKQELIAEKNKIEEEDAKKHKENPFIKFDKNGLSFSKGVPTQVGKVLAGWKDLLKLAPNIHITTIEDARNNRSEYTGEHRAIGSTGLDYKQQGVMRQLPSGDYYIAFTKSTSITKMLETIAHEFGHIHQKEVWSKADNNTKIALMHEHEKWVALQGNKTAKELIKSLRAKTTGKTTIVPNDLMAKDLSNYWKSFSEWYADQTAKWAITSEKPVGIVEKYFKRLGEALRSFYAKVRNSGYLPNELFKEYMDTVTKENLEQHPIVSNPEDQMALFMKSEVEEPKKVETATTENGQAALDITGALGRVTKDPDPSYVKKVTEAWNNAKDNPKATAQDAKAAVVNWNDRVQTWAFSSDAAINNSIRREIKESGKSNEEMIGTLLSISQSQVVHGDAMANLFLTEGNLKYNDELHKWEAEKNDSNLPELAKQIGEIKDKYGLTLAQAELIGHTAFEAKRLKSLVEFNNKVAEEVKTMRLEADRLDAQSKDLNAFVEFNNKIDNEVKAMRAEADKLVKSGKDEDANNIREKAKKRLKDKKVIQTVAANALREKASRRAKDDKFIHMTSAEIEAGNRLFDVIPELKGAVKTWNEMRDNASKVLMDGGLWSKEEAEFLLSNADYVPFFREEQLEQGKGPKEYIRGLMVEAQEKKLKGSNKPVNDIFDNMSRWLQYSVNRAVRNKSALSLIDTAKEYGQARQVESRAGNENVVRVWRNGKEEFHEMSDPMFVEAFTGLESIAIPSWKLAMKFANTLRQSIVLNPIFSAAQVPQDAFAAMFTSGLKPRYALQIPARAVKEFLLTLTHRSATNNELKKYGVVGVRDFTSQMARLDAQTFAGLKGNPTLWGKVKSSLEHVAMASDNAVRQATYEAAMKQGLSKAEAIEKSFEIWNIRRKGTSKTLAMSSQLIPFFSAYLTAQNVAIKTISGVGTSPTERMAALGVLASTTASVMTLSLLYSMLVGDDEGYNKKPAAVRDRMLVIPGTNGLGIPLRSDIFSIPKILGEHLYLMMTDKGFEDGRKFRDSMYNALMNSITSPTVVPQLIKPVVEIMTNHDFFQNRPLVGEYQKRMETERQFNDSTSELAKIMGKTGYISPINADHLIRGWFGSLGGLTIYMTNPLLHSDPNVTKPTMSAHEMLAELPGTSAFMSKEKESGLKNDFYVLRDEVAKVSNTLADLHKRNPEKIPEYYQREGVKEKAGMSSTIQAINKNIGDMDKAISTISNLPDSKMSPDQKSERIKQIREGQEQLLKNANVTKLREMAKI